MPKKSANPKLQWLESYEKYLKSHKAKVFDKRARAVMKSDAETKISATKALRRLGLLTPSGRLKLTA